jgi:hypothetical protein
MKNIKLKCPCGQVIKPGYKTLVALRRVGDRRAKVCSACRKKAWRSRGGEAVERDREASRRWKRKNLGQPGRAAA